MLGYRLRGKMDHLIFYPLQVLYLVTTMFEMALVAQSQFIIHVFHKRFNTCQRKSKCDWWHGFTLLDSAENQGENYVFDSLEIWQMSIKKPKIKSDVYSHRQERNNKKYLLIDWIDLSVYAVFAILSHLTAATIS